MPNRRRRSGRQLWPLRRGSPTRAPGEPTHSNIYIHTYIYMYIYPSVTPTRFTPTKISPFSSADSGLSYLFFLPVVTCTGLWGRVRICIHTPTYIYISVDVLVLERVVLHDEHTLVSFAGGGVGGSYGHYGEAEEAPPEPLKSQRTLGGGAPPPPRRAKTRFDVQITCGASTAYRRYICICNMYIHMCIYI